jgi:hypothetical protein
MLGRSFKGGAMSVNPWVPLGEAIAKSHEEVREIVARAGTVDKPLPLLPLKSLRELTDQEVDDQVFET